MSGEAGAILRQWRQPREFRIRSSAWPTDVQSAFDDLARALPKAIGARPGSGEAPPDTGLETEHIADLATNLWRLSDRMMSSADGSSRVAQRHLKAAWNDLKQAGVEVQDHLDEPFDSGLALKVVEFQPMADIDRERVIQTHRPSVYLNGKVIQMGEVIVGTPKAAADRSPEEGRGSR